MNFENKYLSNGNGTIISSPFGQVKNLRKPIFLKRVGLVHKSVGGVEKGADTSQKVMLVFRPRTLTNTDFQRKNRHGHESGKLYES